MKWSDSDFINEYTEERLLFLEMVVQRTRDLHKRMYSIDSDNIQYEYCGHCSWSYPCPSIITINGENTSGSSLPKDSLPSYGFGEINKVIKQIRRARSKGK